MRKAFTLCQDQWFSSLVTNQDHPGSFKNCNEIKIAEGSLSTNILKNLPCMPQLKTAEGVSSSQLLRYQTDWPGLLLFS